MWDAIKWSLEFKDSNEDKKKSLLMDVWKNTIKIVQDGRYYADGEVIIDSSKACQNSLFFDMGEYDKWLISRNDKDEKDNKIKNLNCIEYKERKFKTEISVMSADCLEQARLLDNPLVLNMASYKNPGGGVVNGSMAQEENIFRRSNLFQSLYQFVYYSDQYGIKQNDKNKYPLPFYGGVYSNDITVFRGSENNGYYLLGKPFKTSFISISAIKRPELKNGKMNKSDISKMKNKIKVIFEVALANSHENLVLSAFGCGAYGNPPEQIALIFKELLNNEYDGCFKKIVFSIFDDHNSYKEHNPNGNYKPFKQILENE